MPSTQMNRQEQNNPAETNTKDELVVFSIIRNSECAECGAEMAKGSFLRVEHEKALCLACADLDRLVFLPRGDVAVTRRRGQ